MFAVGFYWLATKDRPTRRHAPVAPPPAHSAAGRVSSTSINSMNGGVRTVSRSPITCQVNDGVLLPLDNSTDGHKAKNAKAAGLGACRSRGFDRVEFNTRLLQHRRFDLVVQPTRHCKRLYLKAAVHMDWLRSALTTNTYAHAYTSTPGENEKFENISQDTDCIGPPCRIRTCGLRLRRPLLYPTELRAVDEKRHGSRHGPHPSEAPNDRHPPFDAPKQNGPGMKPSPKLYPITAQYRARSASRHHTGCPCSMNHPKQNSPAITQYTPNAASRPRPSK